ncbi:class I SAM-dependent methyltransferase [Pleurocapsales cyanobacterium LEGE 10410]|nr:class I SAM-dependent methyltransferase [Pleurocapsales cyanobacterium LEGE 10410]
MDNLKYITADLSAPEADLKIDITDISFDSESFDVVICSHVLEHIDDDNKAIGELFRVLKHNGVAYIQVPYNSSKLTDEDPSANPQERKKRFGQSDHVRLYGTDFLQRLESPGFKVTQERHAVKLDSKDREQFGVWDDVIFKCIK